MTQTLSNLNLFSFRYKIFARPSTSSFDMWNVYTRPFTLALWSATIGMLLFFAFSFACLDQEESSEGPFAPPTQSKCKKRFSIFLPWSAFTLQGLFVRLSHLEGSLSAFKSRSSLAERREEEFG